MEDICVMIIFMLALIIFQLLWGIFIFTIAPFWWKLFIKVNPKCTKNPVLIWKQKLSFAMIKNDFQRVHNFCKQKGSGFKQFLFRNNVKIQSSFFEAVSAKLNLKKG